MLLDAKSKYYAKVAERNAGPFSFEIVETAQNERSCRIARFVSGLLVSPTSANLFDASEFDSAREDSV